MQKAIFQGFLQGFYIVFHQIFFPIIASMVFPEIPIEIFPSCQKFIRGFTYASLFYGITFTLFQRFGEISPFYTQIPSETPIIFLGISPEGIPRVVF